MVTTSRMASQAIRVELSGFIMNAVSASRSSRTFFRSIHIESPDRSTCGIFSSSDSSPSPSNVFVRIWPMIFVSGPGVP